MVCSGQYGWLTVRPLICSSDIKFRRKSPPVPISNKKVCLGAGTVVRLPFGHTLEFSNTSQKEDALLYICNTDCL